jgi:hypothetical protein
MFCSTSKKEIASYDPEDWDLATRELDIAGVYWWRKIRS